MTRILDIDLDFFVHDVAHWRTHDDNRLDPEEFPPWSIEDALNFLRDRCLLTEPLPGIVVERHGELFDRWRQAIDEGLLAPPFSITHVDAHADLGLGDVGYVYLLNEVLRRPVTERQHPTTGEGGLEDGNYLAFAIGCRWVRDLTYVFNKEDPGPDDLMRDFDLDADAIQLACMTEKEIENAVSLSPRRPSVIDHREPEVPFTHQPWPAFQASAPFDVICLARSAAFTPAASDTLFDEIRRQFIDESAFRGRRRTQ